MALAAVPLPPQLWTFAKFNNYIRFAPNICHSRPTAIAPETYTPLVRLHRIFLSSHYSRLSLGRSIVAPRSAMTVRASNIRRTFSDRIDWTDRGLLSCGRIARGSASKLRLLPPILSYLVVKISRHLRLLSLEDCCPKGGPARIPTVGLKANHLGGAFFCR